MHTSLTYLLQTAHKMASSSSLVLLAAALVALASWQQAIAYDPSPLQDFCVADKNSPGTHVYACMLLNSV